VVASMTSPVLDRERTVGGQFGDFLSDLSFLRCFDTSVRNVQ